MKKTLLVLFILMGILGAEVSGRERDLPIDKQLPDIGSDWVRRNGAGARGDFAWANFDHKTTGDVLSFVAWNVPPSTEVSDSMVGQASIEMFLENGTARPGTSKQGQPISDTVRHRILSVRLRSAESVRDLDVLEYTYVYDGVKDNPSTIAHGYCVVLGDTALFIQHTSTKAIGSELAFEMLEGILSKHFQPTGAPHSIFRRKTVKTNG